GRHRAVLLPRTVVDPAAAARRLAMPRLPAPPLPRALRPKPKRPGDGNNQGALTPVEGAKTAVDWVDERTSLSPMLRWTLFRKVPRGTNWAYTLGTATLFAFLSQAVAGV